MAADMRTQPVAVFTGFQYIRRGKIFDAVDRRIAQRLEQLGRDQHRHVMRLAIQHPGCLLRRQSHGQPPH